MNISRLLLVLLKFNKEYCYRAGNIKYFSILPKRKKVRGYNRYIKPKVKKTKRRDDSILFVGRFAESKGVDNLIRAYYYVLKKKEVPL